MSFTFFANQRDTAKLFGVSVKTLQQWQVKPKKRQGRQVFYYLPEVMEFRLAGVKKETLNLEQERARLARVQTEKGEIEVAKLRGTVVDVDSVARLLGKLVVDLRTRLLALPSGGAPLLKRCKTIAQVKEEYERQIHDALQDLSDTNPTTFLAELDLPTDAPAAEDDN